MSKNIPAKPMLDAASLEERLTEERPYRPADSSEPDLAYIEFLVREEYRNSAGNLQIETVLRALEAERDSKLAKEKEHYTSVKNTWYRRAWNELTSYWNSDNPVFLAVVQAVPFTKYIRAANASGKRAEEQSGTGLLATVAGFAAAVTAHETGMSIPEAVGIGWTTMTSINVALDIVQAAKYSPKGSYVEILAAKFDRTEGRTIREAYERMLMQAETTYREISKTPPHRITPQSS